MFPRSKMILNKITRYGHTVRHLSSSDAEVSKLCAEFAKLSGGSVDLNKDEATGVATITINNPEKKNAFTGKMMADLHECVSELERWATGRAVVLTGSGNTFCSGGELQTVQKILHKGGDMCKLMQFTTSRLYSLPLISVAAVNGHALGGGAELTTACDFRVMTTKAKIGFVQARMNVSTGWGGGTRLIGLLGRTNALLLLSSGQVLNADQAKVLGFVNEVFDTEDIASEARKWINKTLVGDFTVTRNIKQMVLEGANMEDLAYTRERELFTKLWGSELHRKALNANMKHK